MKLDRSLQLQLLKKFAEIYPAAGQAGKFADDDERASTMANLMYLIEHELITAAALSQPISGPAMIGNIKITAAGLDFLADDGGLSAILGVVTIKLHDDTVRQLIEARIQSADLPETTRSHLLKSLREAPGETIKLLTEKLLDAGLANLPAALPLIQKVLGGLL
ncbi:MAG: hypothetical protein I8H79_05710 [Burkholderiales bacterium]|nr:hypothetical protein [Burkholderiales bacterium]MBH1993843.1 hypothetical protein [Burkholderiales bacterium]MBH2069911.1 hypothetical protein [Burkholderiales bacterium]